MILNIAQHTARSGQRPNGQQTDRAEAPFSVRSVGSGASWESGRASLPDEQKDKELLKLQAMVKVFVKEVRVGKRLDVVLDDGSVVPCNCIMDSNLSTISLQVCDIVRNISMTDVLDVFSGKELERVPTTKRLDELCVTLVMVGERCVSFKFPSILDRENFASCMKILRLAWE